MSSKVVPTSLGADGWPTGKGPLAAVIVPIESLKTQADSESSRVGTPNPGEALLGNISPKPATLIEVKSKSRRSLKNIFGVREKTATEAGAARGWKAIRMANQMSAAAHKPIITKQRRNARDVGGRKPEEYQQKEYNELQSVSYEKEDETEEQDVVEKRTWVKELLVWLVAMVLGIVVSLVTNGLLWLISYVVDKKDRVLDNLLLNRGWGLATLFYVGWGAGTGLIAIGCVMMYPAARSSGIPSVLAYLNGVTPVAPLNLRGKITPVFGPGVMAAKFFGTIAAMSTGLFIGPEGPIIHIGAMVGRIMQHTLDYVFRNHKGLLLEPSQSRDLLAIGAGAGIAAAFSAPLAGVMFVVEEAASVLTVRLIEICFFACSASFWLSRAMSETSGKSVKFDSPTGKNCSNFKIKDWGSFLIIAIVGGALGALFNHLNISINRFRKKRMSSRPLYTVLEALLIILLSCGGGLALTKTWGCKKISAELFIKDSLGCLSDSYKTLVSNGTVTTSFALSYYNSLDLTDEQAEWVSSSLKMDGGKDCGSYVCELGYTCYNNVKCVQEYVYLAEPNVKNKVELKSVMQAACPYKSYNEMGTLMLRPGVDSVKNLFTRGIPHTFSIPALSLFLVTYFLLAVVTSGIAVPSGLFIPQILIGASAGRLACLVEIEIIRQIYNLETDTSGLNFFDWQFSGYKKSLEECSMPDPGAYAVIGASAFLGGSGRISVFLAVVMLELTNDIKLTPIIAVTVLVATWTGNIFNHGLYHGLIQVQSVPFLNPTPFLSMRFHAVSTVMAKPVISLQTSVRASRIRKVLSYPHNAFPVVARSLSGPRSLVGMVTRARLVHALANMKNEDELTVPLNPKVPYTVYEDMPISKAYDAFRSLGLTHLCCIDRSGQLVGIVTRKDLMLWKLNESIGKEADHHEWAPDNAEESRLHNSGISVDGGKYNGGKCVACQKKNKKK